jgi:hypothetical protein
MRKITECYFDGSHRAPQQQEAILARVHDGFSCMSALDQGAEPEEYFAATNDSIEDIILDLRTAFADKTLLNPPE